MFSKKTRGRQKTSDKAEEKKKPKKITIYKSAHVYFGGSERVPKAREKTTKYICTALLLFATSLYFFIYSFLKKYLGAFADVSRAAAKRRSPQLLPGITNLIILKIKPLH